MNFPNALERIPKLVEEYKAQNVTYERDIPILQETVGGVWKKEDELKALKAELVALNERYGLILAPPKPEAGEEQTNNNEEEKKNVGNGRKIAQIVLYGTISILKGRK